MNINSDDLMKGIQKMQKELGSIEESFADARATGAAGAGMVEVDINGKMQMEDIRISDEVFQAGDASMLEDLIMCAYNDAFEKVGEAIKSKTTNLAASMLGGMFQK